MRRNKFQILKNYLIYILNRYSLISDIDVLKKKGIKNIELKYRKHSILSNCIYKANRSLWA